MLYIYDITNLPYGATKTFLRRIFIMPKNMNEKFVSFKKTLENTKLEGNKFLESYIFSVKIDTNIVYNSDFQGKLKNLESVNLEIAVISFDLINFDKNK
jgi:hypothetical protein